MKDRIGAVSIAVLLAGTAFVVLWEAHNSSDFWGVAVPGVLTGVGTLALAAVTVLLARHERERDDRLRATERERDERLRGEQRREVEAQRVYDEQRAEADRVAKSAHEALREARKVVTIPHLNQQDDYAEVVNASAEPIFEVDLLGVRYKPLAGPALWTNSPEADHDSHDITLLRPLESGRLTGQFFDQRNAAPRGSYTGRANLSRYAALEVALGWTDARGNRWQRMGTGEPELIQGVEAVRL